MTDGTHPAIVAAARLQESMAELSEDMRTLRDYGQRNRRYIVGLSISLAIDIFLSIVVGVVAVQANEANSTAVQAQRSQMQTCVAGNDSRAANTQLWNYVLDLSAQDPANQTPAKRQQIKQFRDYMQSAFAQRDCTQIGK